MFVVLHSRLFGSMWNPQDFEEFFKREASFLCRLHHPNVVRFFGVCYRGSKFHLVTEYCAFALSTIIKVRLDTFFTGVCFSIFFSPC
jgi:serine/threonine protein kinase